VVFFTQIQGENTTCGATHQVGVGIPVIFIHQPGSIEAGASPLHIQGEQLLKLLT
jgi:hypothetical protein